MKADTELNKIYTGNNASLYHKEIRGNKMPTRSNRGFIADLIACST